MPKVADVRLGWKKSPSADVVAVKVVVTNNGTESQVDVGPEVEEIVVTVQASGAVQFKVVSTDSEGFSATSVVYDFVLGDLETPQAATDLFHQIIGIREVA